MPDWARGRMNAVHMMASQGGVALGGILWGGAATSFGLGKTLVGGALLLTASLALAIPLSINFAHSLNLDPAPLEAAHDFPLAPKPDDGPVMVTAETIIRPEDREEYLVSVEQLRLIFLRNGAFLFRVDENLEHPGTFRRNAGRSWAEHLRQHATTYESRDRTCGTRLGVAPGRPRAACESLPCGEPAVDLLWLQSFPGTGLDFRHNGMVVEESRGIARSEKHLVFSPCLTKHSVFSRLVPIFGR